MKFSDNWFCKYLVSLIRNQQLSMKICKIKNWREKKKKKTSKYKINKKQKQHKKKKKYKKKKKKRRESLQ